MSNTYDKYFVIGFHKTATCSIHNMFIENKLKSQHQSTNLWKTDKYDCFSDDGGDKLPNYRELDLKYKNAIFILNVRELDKWLISRFKMGLRLKDKHGLLSPKTTWAYPCTHEKCEKWIYDREKRHLEILDYFSTRPNKLIIVNIEREGWIPYLCSQLNLKNKNIESKNITVIENNIEAKKVVEVVNETLENINYNKKTILFPNKELLNKYKTIYNNFI